jgi:hypothetical protein
MLLRLIIKAVLFSYVTIEVNSLLQVQIHNRAIFSLPSSKAIPIRSKDHYRQSGLLYHNDNNVGSNSLKPLSAVVSWPRVEIDQKLTAFGRISRLFSILMLSFSKLLLRARTKIDTQMKSTANAMEEGWYKRGFSGSIARTVEIWRFAISFALKFVSSYSYITIIILSFLNSCQIYIRFLPA